MSAPTRHPSKDNIGLGSLERPTKTHGQVEDERQGRHEYKDHENTASCSHAGSNENFDDQTADATPVQLKESNVGEGNSIPQGNVKEKTEYEQSTGRADNYVRIHGSDDVADLRVGNVGEERDLLVNSRLQMRYSGHENGTSSEAHNEEHETAGECEKRGEEHNRVEEGVNEAGTATEADSEEDKTVEESDVPQKDVFHLPGSESDFLRRSLISLLLQTISANSDRSPSDSDSTSTSDNDSDSDEYYTGDEGSASGYTSSNDSDDAPEDVFNLRGSESDFLRQDDDNHHPKVPVQGRNVPPLWEMGSDVNIPVVYPPLPRLSQHSHGEINEESTSDSSRSSEDDDSSDSTTTDEGEDSDSGYISGDDSDDLPEPLHGRNLPLLWERDPNVNIPVIYPPLPRLSQGGMNEESSSNSDSSRSSEDDDSSDSTTDEGEDSGYISEDDSEYLPEVEDGEEILGEGDQV